MPRTMNQLNPDRLHVAIIMDGNGRWAVSHGLPREAGYREGVKAVRRVVEAAPKAGIGTLTLYAFSADNWHRPSHEVATLFETLYDYLVTDTPACVLHGIRMGFIGRRNRLPLPLTEAMEKAEAATRAGTSLHLRIAIDYSARESIWRAACQVKERSHCPRELFPHLIASANHEETPAPNVDLLIRTGGEQRLSDFLLWECAYAEFVFTPPLWPDFTVEALHAALTEFRRRERRFGKIPQEAAI